MQKYVVLEKAVGETPLSCAERFRATAPELANTPLSYAGRLDPMASGKLLILIGEECKNQTKYHGLDKEYEFSVLFGISSDTQDVLGRLKTENSPMTFAGSHGTESAWSRDLTSDEVSVSADCRRKQSDTYPAKVTGENLATYSNFEQLSESVRLGLAARSALEESLFKVTSSLVGPLTFPYPLFSAKTVQGKPLHMWTLEGRLNEIEIPTRTSEIYELELTKIETLPRQEIAATALQKINTIPKVTDQKKALGNDFRRDDVRADWQDIATDFSLPTEYTIAHFRCIASSGAYMRTLATIIAEKLGTTGLAWHIHRTTIGIYDTDTHAWGKIF